MKKLKIVEFKNPRSGTLSFRVTGSSGTERIRKNFGTFREAEDFCNSETAKALPLPAGMQVAHTTLTQDQLSIAEAAVIQIAGRWPLNEVVAAGIAKLAATAGQPVVTVAKMRDEWKPLIKKEAGSRWAIDLANAVDRFVKAHLRMESDRVTPAVVRGWLDSLKVAAQTKKNLRNRLHHFFGWCVQRGYMRENPASGIAIRRSNVEKKGEEDKGPPVIMTPDQVRVWLDVCQLPRFVPIFGWAVLCTLCGLRPESEAEKLLWEEIDLEKRTMHVLGRKRGVKPRVIELNDQQVSWIKLVKSFDQEAPGYHSRRLFTAALQEANTAIAAQNKKPIRWVEDLQRHTYASMVAAGGIDIVELAKRMGTSTGMIYKHYRHVRPEAEAKVFSSIMPPAPSAPQTDPTPAAEQ